MTEDASERAEQGARPASLGTVAREWTRIGITGFGGPPAHIALLRALVVDRMGWMDTREFQDANAACGLLPACLCITSSSIEFRRAPSPLR